MEKERGEVSADEKGGLEGLVGKLNEWFGQDQVLNGFQEISRGYWVFRGMPSVEYALVPSIARVSDVRRTIQLRQERAILRNFRKYLRAHPSNMTGQSSWEWLALAQHYGASTRLMDWSYSLLVALAFCYHNVKPGDDLDEPSVVWCANLQRLAKAEYADGPLAYLRDDGRGTGYLGFRAEDFGPWTVHSEELGRMHRFAAGAHRHDSGSGPTPAQAFFDDFLAGTGPFAPRRVPVVESDESDATCLFFEPPSIDGRMFAQGSVFSIMSGKQQDFARKLVQHDPDCEVETYPGMECRKDFAGFVGRHSLFAKPVTDETVFCTLVIPPELKRVLRGLLMGNNIHERMLFPDAVGLGQFLNRAFDDRVFPDTVQSEAPTRRTTT